MNDKAIKQFRKKLILLKSELQKMEEEQKQAGKTVELDQTRVGRLSRMDAMQVQQMALEAVRRRQHQILEIDGALRRIESGEYGYCFVCGEEIVAERLKANPACTRCMACAE
ncbi:MAG: TraR/DksA C4-type zinc finger protein [Gammaproteobacteria bacterium]|nr:MAG: TraR/DksA C4-type zinc finger protein [Gammaproteobacteria bacterium]